MNTQESNESQMAPGKLELVRTFLNSWHIPNDTRQPEDVFETREAMEQFCLSEVGELSGPIIPEQVRQLRTDLRHILGNNEITILNQWLVKLPVEVQLEEEKGQTVIRYQPTTGPGCQLCAVMLALVVEAIARHTWSRLKACPDCQWVFYDHTKNRNKVWCLMVAGGPQGRSCGSISKVRSFRERHKATAQQG